MRLIVQTEPGVVELNWMWMPTWIGMNRKLTEDLQKHLSDKYLYEQIGPRTLDAMEEDVLEFIVKRNPNIKGLKEFLRCINLVEHA